MKLLTSLCHLWRNHKPTMLLLAAALVAAVVFGARFAFDHRHWRGRPPEKPPIEAWMTIGFVAHAYHIPPKVIREMIGFEDPEKRLHFDEIASRQGRSVEELLQELDAAIQAHRPKRAAPPPERP
ncbi:MAG: hypothetical protein JXR13_04695 [Thalassovita sp.]